MNVVVAEIVLVRIAIPASVVARLRILLVMIVHVRLQLPPQLLVDVLRMDEVAEATSIARAIIILSAFGFAEVCHWRVLRRQLLLII